MAGRKEGASLITCGQGRPPGEDACADLVMKERSYAREDGGGAAGPRG